MNHTLDITAVEIVKQLELLRANKPLVTNITNYVVMNNTANALLAIGASPIMAHSSKEIFELVKISNALVINIGTLDESWIDRMLVGVEAANLYKKPVILDPVGCGASKLRLDISRKLFELSEYLYIRANGAEVMALAGFDSNSKGVDSLNTGEQAIIAARDLIKKAQNKSYCEIVISGETDHILTKNSYYQLKNGVPMMASVTGMGCTHSALTGAFASVGLQAGVYSTAILGIAGEMAAKLSKGPGSLQQNILDCLYNLSADDITAHLEIFNLKVK